MKYHELTALSNKDRKRVGRGISAGGGKTAGRGTKGQKARTGKKIGATFMGGQGALVQRIPKLRGFKSLRAPAQVVYLDQLDTFTSKVIDNYALFESGIIGTPHHTVKIIARGPITKKITLRVQAASASVVSAINAAGGTFEKTPVPIQMSLKPNKIVTPEPKPAKS